MANDFHTLLKRMKALNEYSRQQQLTRFREDRETLRAVRADLAKRNAYLVEQGLPPLEDSYPELPES
jgi:hypothetical protein